MSILIIDKQISVGCKESPGSSEDVRFEYSRDKGSTWKLVQESCPPGKVKCPFPKEPSIFRSGHHGPWTKVFYPVDHRMSQG